MSNARRAVPWAVAAGLLLALSFPPVGWWPLGIAGVALLTWACQGRRLRGGIGLGLLCGLVLFLVLIRWLTVVGLDAWLMLSGYSALWLGVAGGATALVTRLRGWPLWVAVVWVAQEALRDRIPLGGWPWGRLAFGQADAPWLPAAWWGGTPLLTFLVALSGALVVWGLQARLRMAVAVLVAVALLPWLASLLPGGSPPTGQPVVAVIQGDVPATGLGFAVAGQRREVLDNHVRQTLALAEEVRLGRQPQPDLVIWPENASDLDPYRESDAARAIAAAARAIDAPLLVGAVVTNPTDPTTVLNVGIVWDPATGPGARYAKRHPVPFGEYIPLRGLLTRFIGRFALIPRDFAAGTAAGVLPMAGIPVGDVICFEVAYDDVVRDVVNAGAQILAVQTNNATYTGGGQSEQQVAMARLRAVETGRATVVAATNGISAQFLPDGTPVGWLPEGVAGFLVASLPTAAGLSPAVVLGGWPEGAAVLAAAVVVVIGLRRDPGLIPRSPGTLERPDEEGMQG